MENGRHDGIKDMGNKHDPFGEKNEHGENGDDDIVVGDTSYSISISYETKER